MDRIHGTEMEWGAMVVHPKQSMQFQLNGNVLEDHVKEAMTKNGTAFIGRNNDHYLENGARLYRDGYERWEYATPEDISYAGTTANEFAGERYLADTAALYKEETGNNISFTKRVIDDKERSCGYHVSYCLDAKKVKITEDALALYGVFAATRSVVFGSGALLPGGKFILGQKAFTANCDYSPHTIRQKPVVNLRDEPLANPDKFTRFHDTLIDPSMSPWSSRVKIAAGSIVARMVEANEHMPWLRFDSPLCLVARNTSADNRLALQHRLISGNYISAIDVQQIIVKHARHLAEESTISLNDEEQWALEEWEGALKDLAQNPALTNRRIEWIDRLKILDRQHERHGYGWDSEYLRYKDRQFSEIATQGIAKALRETIWSEYMPENSLIKERMHRPPATRAAIRGRFIQKVADRPNANLSRIMWSNIRYRGVDYQLSDPYQSTDQDLDAIA